MRKEKTLRLIRGAAVACAALTVVSVGAAQIASAWEPNINEALGTTSLRVVNSPDAKAEDLYTYENKDIKSSGDLVAWHKELAEREQEEGSVLLKNTDSALPLAAGAKITLLGSRSVNSVHGGQIGSSPNGKQNVSLETALKDRGFSVNPTTVSAYKKMAKVPTGNKIKVWGQEKDEMYTPGSLSNSFGMVNSLPAALGINEPTVDLLKQQEATFESSFSEYGDAAIVVVGRPSSEAADFYPGAVGRRDSEFDEGDSILSLSKNEKAIIDYACTKFGKVIVLVNSDSAMEVEYLKDKPEVNAVMWIGAVGNYGFYGVADLLKGAVSPSGHLPDTYAVDSTSSPAMVNYGLFKFSNFESYGGNTDGSKGFAYLDEKEGIYTGYRYYETRYEDSVLGQGSATSTKGSISGAWNYDNEVSYTFGYGMSYASFTQEIVANSFKREGGKISVDVKVTNTSSTYTGKDVVQVYVQTPYTQYDKDNHVEKSAIQLADFAKTPTLYPASQAAADKPNSATVTVSFDEKYIASYDYVNAKTYILDAGDYYLSIGNGAHEALNNVLAAKGNATVGGDTTKTQKWTVAALDKTTYAKSNDTAVTNHLDDMNVNYWTGDKSKLYEGQLSRSNWDSTWPTASALTATQAMIKELTNDIMTTEGYDTTPTEWGKKTGITIGALKGAKYDDNKWEELLSSMTLDEAIDFYCRGQNWTYQIPTIGLVAQHVQDGPLGFSYQPLGAFNEDETGDPAAMKADDANKDYSIYDSVTEPVLAASFNKELLEEQGELFGTDSLWSNSAVLWAPGLNTHRTPYNGRNHEYYSEDSMLTNYMGAALTRGANKYGLIVAPKHFAFNDQETNRTGVSVFMNEQRAREIELRAFQGAFADAGCNGTMTAFNRAGIRYASAHKGLMTDILRNEWGFKGYAVTDMINGPMYMRADTALMAGTTILDTSNNETSRQLIENIKNDPAAQNMLKEAMHRNLYTLANSNALQGVDINSRVEFLTPWWKALLIALEAVFGTLTGLAVVGYIVATVLKKNDNDKENA